MAFFVGKILSTKSLKNMTFITVCQPNRIHLLPYVGNYLSSEKNSVLKLETMTK